MRTFETETSARMNEILSLDLFHCSRQTLAQAVSKSGTMSADQVVRGDDGQEVRFFRETKLNKETGHSIIKLIFETEIRKSMVFVRKIKSTFS